MPTKVGGGGTNGKDPTCNTRSIASSQLENFLTLFCKFFSVGLEVARIWSFFISTSSTTIKLT